MGIYDRQIASAKRLIAAKGQLVIWRQIQDISSSKPWKPSGQTDTDNNVRIVFLPYSVMAREFIRQNKGDDVPTGMLYGLMAAVNFEPKVKDIVVRPNDTLNVVTVDPLAPNGDILLYTVGFET